MTHHDKARELVERLRRQKTTDEMERHEVINADFEGAYDLLVRDCRDAADLITALAEENQRLREALEPFAAIADLFDSEVEGHSDTDELSLFYGDGANWLADRFTLAQFNAARAALSSGEASHD